MFLVFRIDFKPYHIFFDAVPDGFKIMIVVVSFTLFQICQKHGSVIFVFLMIPFLYLTIFCSHEFF